MREKKPVEVTTIEDAVKGVFDQIVFRVHRDGLGRDGKPVIAILSREETRELFRELQKSLVSDPVVGTEARAVFENDVEPIFERMQKALASAMDLLCEARLTTPSGREAEARRLEEASAAAATPVAAPAAPAAPSSSTPPVSATRSVSIPPPQMPPVVLREAVLQLAFDCVDDGRMSIDVVCERAMEKLNGQFDRREVMKALMKRRDAA